MKHFTAMTRVVRTDNIQLGPLSKDFIKTDNSAKNTVKSQFYTPHNCVQNWQA